MRAGSPDSLARTPAQERPTQGSHHAGSPPARSARPPAGRSDQGSGQPQIETMLVLPARLRCPEAPDSPAVKDQLTRAEGACRELKTAARAPNGPLPSKSCALLRTFCELRSVAHLSMWARPHVVSTPAVLRLTRALRKAHSVPSVGAPTSCWQRRECTGLRKVSQARQAGAAGNGGQGGSLELSMVERTKRSGVEGALHESALLAMIRRCNAK